MTNHTTTHIVTLTTVLVILHIHLYCIVFNLVFWSSYSYLTWSSDCGGYVFFWTLLVLMHPPPPPALHVGGQPHSQHSVQRVQLPAALGNLPALPHQL